MVGWNKGLTKETSEIIRKQGNEHSIRMSGKNHPMFGKHHTSETIEKMCLIKLGKKQSLETRLRKSIVSKGKPKKYFILCIPTLCDCKGRNGCSTIIYKRERKYALGHYINKINPMKDPEISKKSGTSKVGTKLSKETCEKISKNHRDMKGKKNHMYGKPAKHKVHIYLYQSPLQGEVCLKMSYEFECAKYLDSINEPWYYEFKFFPFIFNNKEVTYTPDFYLSRLDKFIEVKGWWRRDRKEKFEAFKKAYPEINIEVLMLKDLQKLGIKVK